MPYNLRKKLCRARWIKKMSELGNCTSCGNPVDDKDKKRCNSCRKKSCENAKKQKQRAKVEGKCRVCCSREKQDGKTTCRKCRPSFNMRQRLHRAALKLAGLCMKCGKPKEQKAKSCCNSCLKYFAEKWRLYSSKKKRTNHEQNISSQRPIMGKG